MIISHPHKFIFCHAPKTGGTTIEHLLKKYNNSQKVNGHASMKFASNILGHDIFVNYFKFGCVRNPWSLEVSRYFYIRNTPNHPRHSWAKNDFKTFINTFAEKMKNMNFNQFRINDAWVLDYTIRVENFQRDFDIVCDKIGIPRQKLPHLNKSKHKHHTEYYDDETRDIVAEKYKQDIGYFGYEFGR